MCDITSAAQYAYCFQQKKYRTLLSHMTLHRGWHRYGDDINLQSRPIENTRQAYLDAVSIGARFVECDVHCTSDGQVVLAHDPTFRLQSEDAESILSNTPINQLSWSEISTIRFKDQSEPVLLVTVLGDLRDTGVLLAVEIKDKHCALPLVSLLSARSDLISSVGLVMSFDFDEVEAFHQGFVKEAHRLPPFPIAWLLCNPSIEEKYGPPYHTYSPVNETFDTFLTRVGLLDRFRLMQSGVYLQQNPTTSLQQMECIRDTVARILNCNRSEVFIGLWNDSLIDRDIDNSRRVELFKDHVNCINTDLPSQFFVEE